MSQLIIRKIFMLATFVLFLSQATYFSVTAFAEEFTFYPLSRGCEGSPGQFEINSDSVTYGECSEVPYTVIRDRVKKDGNWYGSGETKEARTYRDYIIYIDRKKYCLSKPEVTMYDDSEIFRFVILKDKAPSDLGNTIFMAYRTLDSLKDNKLNTWCMYDAREQKR